MDTLTTIKNIIYDQLDIIPEKIKLETTLEELDIEALDRVLILNDLGDEYHLYLEDNEDLITIADLVDYVEREIKNNG
ncbi:MAG: phosphopantetheine-binding protein [Erysipelotrichaceae bacterium]|nr:phosphopantetheine-binding protein [Erysipelotrichaceae bacterium]